MKVGDILETLGDDTRFTIARENEAGLYPVIREKGTVYTTALGCVFTKKNLPKDIFRRYLFLNVEEIKIGMINGEDTLILRVF